MSTVARPLAAASSPELLAAIAAEADAAAAAVRARRHVDSLLAERQHPIGFADEPAFLTMGALAKRLGISVATVRRLNPPAVVVGDASSRRYDLADVRAWLASREPCATTPPAKTKADDVDVGAILARGGLRAVAGGVRGGRGSP